MTAAPVHDPLVQALLGLLAEEPADAAVSLPRIGKRLGLGGSVVMRALSQLGTAAIGGQPGPGWVQVEQDDGRWLARLTDAGRAALAQAACAGDEAPAPVVRHAVQVWTAEGGRDGDDTIAAEVPVALVFNGISHAVMMATPQDLEDFALGFALSEGIIDSPGDCRGIEVQAAAPDCSDGELPTGAASFEVQIEISSRSFARLKDRRRSLVGRTGCGVCGTESLDALDLVPERVQARAWLAGIDLAVVQRAFASFSAQQPLNAAAGAIHAAGWATPEGELLDVLEDVGRHNALDKLIGRLARQQRLGSPGFAVMSSRASYELVRKCARLDIPALATISAPTSLAIRIAEQAGIRLWGLCRGPRAVLYAAG